MKTFSYLCNANKIKRVLTPKQTQTMEKFMSAVESYNRVQKDLANKAREVIVKILTPRDMVLETCEETHITYRDRHGNYHCDLIEWIEVQGGHIIIHTENRGRKVQWPAVIDDDKIKIAETLIQMKKEYEEWGK